MDTPKVVIIGSSYSSAAVFYNLIKYLVKSRTSFDILLIADKGYFYFKDLIFQYLCNDCDVSDIGQEFRNLKFLSSPIKYLEAKILGVDFKQKIIQSDKGQINYEYLILAPQKNYFYTDPLFKGSNIFLVNSLNDVFNLKKHIISNLEIVALERDTNKKKMLLSYSVIGSSKEGVELACSIYDLHRNLLKKQFPEIDKNLIKVNLIEKENTIGMFKESIYSNYLLYNLNKKGIKVLTNSQVTSVAKNKIIINNEKEILSGNIVLIPENKNSTLIESLALNKDEKLNAIVDLYLKAKDDEDVFVIGEAAKHESLDYNSIPSLRHFNDQANICAYNVFAKLNNNPLKTLNQNSEVEFTFLGYRNSLVQIKGFCFSGYIAWFLNRIMHIWCFLGFTKKVRTLISLLLGILSLKDYFLLDIALLKEDKSLDEELHSIKNKVKVS